MVGIDAGSTGHFDFALVAAENVVSESLPICRCQFSRRARRCFLGGLLVAVGGCMDELLVEFHRSAPCPLAEIDAAEAALKMALPADYRAFLEMSDGGEGFIGVDYLILWRASELQPFNRDYAVPTYAAGLVGFGSNGGGEMFAFDGRFQPPPVVIVPFIGMSHDDAAVVADTFIGLLRRMKRAAGSLRNPPPEWDA
jgi:hypothetical protein